MTPPLAGNAAAVWQPIETAPRDGSWFVICHDGDDGFYEVGQYDPSVSFTYEQVEGGLFRRLETPGYEWRGFNNFAYASHWMPLPKPPAAPSGLENEHG